MKPGEIVLIRFPRSDLLAGKLRPALVIAVAPGRHADLLLALITSQIHQAIPSFDEIIEATDTDYQATGLKVRSAVRLARLVSVEAAMVNARLGSISHGRLGQIRARLADWIQR